MGKYILILILSFGGYMFGQGIEPIQIEASPYKNGLLVAKEKVWSEWLQDSVYIYEHSEALTTADSTNVTAGWGITVVESPAQTFNVKADTTKLATQYDLNGMVTGTGVATRVAFWNGTNSLSSNSNLYWDNVNSRLGIGTTTPSKKLEVLGGFSFGDQSASPQSEFSMYHNMTPAFMSIRNDAAVHGAGFNFRSDANSVTFYQFGSTNNSQGFPGLGTINIGGKDFAFFSNATVPAPIMLLKTNGNVGIGTASPARTLHVTGEARITDLTTDTPTAIVGADADGDLGSISIGSGLSLSGGTLTATDTTPDGSETKVTAGTGIGVTGTGTVASPYVVTNTGDISSTNEYIDYVKNYPTYPTQILLGYPYSVISDNSGTTDYSISFPGFSTTSTTGGFVSGSNNQTTKFLRGDNTWQDVGTGTITSVGLTTGTTGTDVNVSGSPLTGSGGTITLNIPSASATARGLVTTGLQTFAGSKTFSYLGGSPVGGNSLIVADVNGKLENLYGAAGVNDGKVPTWNGTAFTLQTPPGGMTSWNLQANGGTTTAITNGQTVNFTGSGIASVSRSGNTITVAATEVDGSVTNELDNVTTNLSVSGTSSPLTLNSSDGTDVTFTAGSNITLTGTSGNITIAAASTGLPAGASSNTLAYLSGAWTASSFLKTNSSNTATGTNKRVDVNNDGAGETFPFSVNTATKFLVNGRVQSNSTMSGTTGVTLLGRNTDQELGTVTLGSGLAMTGAVLSASTPFFSFKSNTSEYTQTMAATPDTYVTLNMGSGTSTQQNSTTVFTNGPVGNTIQVLQDGSYEINYSFAAKATTASATSVTLGISNGSSTLNNRKQEMAADKWQIMSSSSIMGLSANDTIGIHIANSVASNTMTYSDVSLTVKKL